MLNHVIYGDPLLRALLIFLLPICAFSAPSLHGQDLDFQKDILPIFEEHCYECHGNGKREGGLSLESITGLQKGGESGSPIFTPKASDSELFLRISSLSKGYRMPKRGESLSQPEISKIAKWIFQNAALAIDSPPADATAQQPLADKPSTPVQSPTASLPLVETRPPVVSSTPRTRSKTAPVAGSGILSDYGISDLFALIAATAFICFAICWIFYKVLVSRRKSRRIDMNQDQKAAFFAMAIGAMNCVLIIFSILLYVKTNELTKENKILRAKTGAVQSSQTSNVTAAPVVAVDANHLPLPPYPMHPPRLGGQYYRGNDERDNTLFNGGFYRTATIDLRLVNDNDEQLQWGDPIDGKLFVEIEITRAPKSTRELFTDRIADMTSVRHYSQLPSGTEQTLKLDVLDKENRWLVKVPLPDLRTESGKGRLEGMVYLMYGNQPGEQRLPRPHFGVKYDLRFEGGQTEVASTTTFASAVLNDSDDKEKSADSLKIKSDSVLWMGSMYTLNNRVLVPNSEQVLLDRWFDWRPIPEIEGDAAEDPALIGTTEHLAQ